MFFYYKAWWSLIKYTVKVKEGRLRKKSKCTQVCRVILLTSLSFTKNQHYLKCQSPPNGGKLPLNKHCLWRLMHGGICNLALRPGQTSCSQLLGHCLGLIYLFILLFQSPLPFPALCHHYNLTAFRGKWPTFKTHTHFHYLEISSVHTLMIKKSQTGKISLQPLHFSSYSHWKGQKLCFVQVWGILALDVNSMSQII